MPYRDFTVGQVLTSAQVDEFLMRQTVMVFDNSTNRATSLDGVLTQGMIAYLKDTDALEQYSGAVWTPVGVDSFTKTGQRGQMLISDGIAGVVWQNSISPLLLLGV
jgi:hypothetical protein